MAPLPSSSPGNDEINFEAFSDFTSPNDLWTLETANTNNIFNDEEELGLGGDNLFFAGTDGGDIFVR